MCAFALIWNPKHFDWEKRGFRSDLQSLAATSYVDRVWSSGWIHATGPAGPRKGDRFFLLRVGTTRPGLVGYGRFLSRPSKKLGTFRGTPLARVRFEYLADYRRASAFLSRGALVLLTGDPLSYPASGMPMAPETAGRLELLAGMLRASNHRLPLHAGE
jgi:hypothetical protein